MNYRQEYSSTKQGVGYIVLSLVLGVIFLGALYGISLANDPSDALSGRWGTADYLFSRLGFTFFTLMVTGGVLFGIRYGVMHINASRNWLVEITDGKLTYQAPEERIGQTIAVELDDIISIKHVIKKYNNADIAAEEHWYFALRNGSQVSLFGHSPLNHEKLRDALLIARPTIVFQSLLFVDDNLVKGSAVPAR